MARFSHILPGFFAYTGPVVRAGSGLLIVMLVAASLAAACGGGSANGSAFEELGKLTPIQGARPVLVFVYNDG